MKLTWSDNSKAFALLGDGQLHQDTVRKAKEVGMDWSRPDRVWFTRNRYRAYHFYDLADETAQGELFWLHLYYRASFSDSASARGLVIPEGRSLLPFQVAGVRQIMDRGGGLIGDDRGLGKTLQAIVLANSIRARRVLAIVPGKARLQWAAEIRRWYIHPDGKRPVIYPVTSGKDGVHPDANWVILSYELASQSLKNTLCRMGFDLMVTDEAHRLKSPSTKRTRAILGNLHKPEQPAIANNVELSVPMTGTPLPGRPREAYTLARHLDFDAIDRMSEAQFIKTFNPKATMPNGYVVEKAARLPELAYRMRGNFMVRRSKEQVLSQLPDLRTSVIHVDQTGGVMKAIEAERKLDFDVRGRNFKPKEEQETHIATVRREMGEAKIPLEARRVQDLLDSDVQAMFIVCIHRHVINVLAHELDDYGAFVIDGRTSAKRRQAVEKHLADGTCRVVIGQMQAAGEALDGLQHHISWIDILEPSWVPGENEQAIDRLRRIGQSSGQVNAQFVVAPKSIDEDVVEALCDKLRTTEKVLEA